MSADDDDFEDRAAILRRRAVFLVSAVAGMSLSGCGDNPRPEPSLNMPAPGAEEATPPETEAAFADAGTESSRGDSDAGQTFIVLDAGMFDAPPAPSNAPKRPAPGWTSPVGPTVCLNFDVGERPKK
ncbi:MAG: hypothetical protein HOW73_26900 [Polyangiaceae bacterium]|nr:hypothetical protein [Polyangiaceae bacterium]